LPAKLDNLLRVWSRSVGQAFQPDGLTSEAGQSATGVVTALLMCAATPLELAEESRFLTITRFNGGICG
jgi:hypothetical protein